MYMCVGVGGRKSGWSHNGNYYIATGPHTQHVCTHPWPRFDLSWDHSSALFAQAMDKGQGFYYDWKGAWAPS